MVDSGIIIPGGSEMHPLKGRKQSKEHVAKRARAIKETFAREPWRKSGPPKNTEIVFWSMVDQRRPNDCWPWLGYTSDFGYGRIDIFGEKGVYAHRVAYFLLPHSGRIPLKENGQNILVLHRCDNPACCNPRHLYLGSHNDNMQDKVKRGRSKWFDSSTDSPRAKLTAHDVRQIRKQKKQGATLNALALLYDVHRSTIKGILSGRHYSDIR
jgi:HNH endonuclease